MTRPNGTVAIIDIQTTEEWSAEIAWSGIVGRSMRGCWELELLLRDLHLYFCCGTKLFRQIVGIPMGTNGAPLVADLFLFCYERDFTYSLSEEKQSEVIGAFSLTSRYLDDLSNIDSKHFNGLISKMYPSELPLNKTKSSETEAPFLDLHLSILDGFISCKKYDKRDDF